MSEGLNGIISQLEQQKAAIDKALAALREVDGASAPAAAAAVPVSKGRATRKGGMSPEGKERLIAALKKRWAAKKRSAKKEASPAAPVANAATPAPAKGGGMTDEGRRRLAEAMKRRWAVKRAASAVKKGGRKKAA
jgi:hypothetical protein